MFAASVCYVAMLAVLASRMADVEAAAADDRSRRGTCVCNCILSPTEGVKNPC